MATRLSVVIPSRKPWPHPAAAVDAVYDQVLGVGGEVLLAVGHPQGAPAVAKPGIRVITTDGNDVFAARSQAITEADGDIVALLEDHCFAPPGWAAGLLTAWDRNPQADALVTIIENGAPRPLDHASFLLTWGPFIGPLATVPLHRTPSPGVLSYRKSVLPDSPPPRGWLEYDLPVQLRNAGRMAVDDTLTMIHTQHLGLRAFALQYWAGRGYAGLHDHPAAKQPLWDRLRYASGMPARLVRQTHRALVARNGTADPVTLALVGAMAVCNTVGQLVGVVIGTPGRSLRELE
jgi:hypothetical protein